MLYYLKIINFLICLIVFSNTVNATQKKQSFPIIWNVQNANDYYVGRKSLLSNIYTFFSKGNRELTIVGSAGIGKTQLVKKYTGAFKNQYDIIWWFDVGNNMDDQYVKLAYEWNRINNGKFQISTYLPQEDIIKQIKEYLRVSNLNWLLIFDNVTDKNKIRRYIPDKHSKSFGHILITSKNPYTWGNTMKLEKFIRAESIELLLKITNENDTKHADNLAEILADYPLALVQAASYIKSHPGVDIQEYTKLFLTSRKKLWEEEGKNHGRHAAFDNYDFTVFTTLSLIVDEIKKESKAAFDLLVFCSYLNNKHIPEILLNYYAINILKIDDLSFRNILSILGKYSLISQNKPENSSIINKNTTFTIHELSQLSIQDILSNQKKKEYLVKSLNATANFLSDKFDIFIPYLLEHTYLVLNMESIAKHATRAKIYNNYLLMLEQRIFEYYFIGKRDYKIAQKTISLIEELLEKNTNPPLISQVRYAMMKSSLLAFQNIDLQESLKQIFYALELLKDISKPRDEHLMVYTKLAQLYHMMGDNDKALIYTNLGKELIRNNNGIGAQDAFFQTLARIYNDQGDFKTALQYSVESINNITPKNSKLSANVIPIYATKPIVLLKMAKYEEAYQLLKELYDAQDIIFGKSVHAYKAIIYCHYGYALFKHKNMLSEARNLLLKSQEIFIKVFNEGINKNKNFAISNIFLGEIYEKEGDNIKAQFAYIKALQIMINNYNGISKATDYFSELYTRLAIINVKLKDTASAQHYLNLHSKVFGYDHPRTTQIVEYFIDYNMAVGF